MRRVPRNRIAKSCAALGEVGKPNVKKPAWGKGRFEAHTVVLGAGPQVILGIKSRTAGRKIGGEVLRGMKSSPVLCPGTPLLTPHHA